MHDFHGATRSRSPQGKPKRRRTGKVPWSQLRLETGHRAGRWGHSETDCGMARRPPVEQRHAQEFLQLRHLPPHRRLLNAVRDVPRRLGDPAVAGDVVEDLQMMDVHSLLLRSMPGWRSTLRRQFEPNPGLDARGWFLSTLEVEPNRQEVQSRNPRKMEDACATPCLTPNPKLKSYA